MRYPRNRVNSNKGIIAGELKKGAKVQITGFGNFEARKRAARMGRNPKTGGVIQIKGAIAPAFRPHKALSTSVATPTTAVDALKLFAETYRKLG